MEEDMNNLQNNPALMLALTATVFVQLIALVIIVDRSKREHVSGWIREFKRGWTDAGRKVEINKQQRRIDRDFYKFTKKVDRESGRIF